MSTSESAWRLDCNVRLTVQLDLSNSSKGRNAMMKKMMLLLVAITSMALADSTLAYRVYNKSSQDRIEVWGQHCPKCFHAKISMGDSKSCPGDKKGCGGLTTISAIMLVPDSPYSNTEKCQKCSVRVPAHGWVEFVDDKGGFTSCVVYDKNGNALNGEAFDRLMKDAPGECR